MSQGGGLYRPGEGRGLDDLPFLPELPAIDGAGNLVCLVSGEGGPEHFDDLRVLHAGQDPGPDQVCWLPMPLGPIGRVLGRGDLRGGSMRYN